RFEDDVEIFDTKCEIQRVELPAAVERDAIEALDDRQALRVENLPAAADTLHVEAPGRYTSSRAELDEDIHNQAGTVGARAVAERDPIALLDDRASGAGLDFGSAEVDRAGAIGRAGDEIEVAEDVARLEDLLETRQQPLQFVGGGRRLRAHVVSGR